MGLEIAVHWVFAVMQHLQDEQASNPYERGHAHHSHSQIFIRNILPGIPTCPPTAPHCATTSNVSEQRVVIGQCCQAKKVQSDQRVIAGQSSSFTRSVSASAVRAEGRRRRRAAKGAGPPVCPSRACLHTAFAALPVRCWWQLKQLLPNRWRLQNRWSRSWSQKEAIGARLVGAPEDGGAHTRLRTGHTATRVVVRQRSHGCEQRRSGRTWAETESWAIRAVEHCGGYRALLRPVGG